MPQCEWPLPLLPLNILACEGPFCIESISPIFGHRYAIILTAGWAPLHEAFDALSPPGQDSRLLLHATPVPHHALLRPPSSACCLLLHPGGSGTTATALLAGCPQLLAPLHYDQPFWAGRLAHLGLSPLPLDAAEVFGRRSRHPSSSSSTEEEGPPYRVCRQPPAPLSVPLLKSPLDRPPAAPGTGPFSAVEVAAFPSSTSEAAVKGRSGPAGRSLSLATSLTSTAAVAAAARMLAGRFSEALSAGIRERCQQMAQVRGGQGGTLSLSGLTEGRGHPAGHVNLILLCTKATSFCDVLLY